MKDPMYEILNKAMSIILHDYTLRTKTRVTFKVLSKLWLTLIVNSLCQALSKIPFPKYITTSLTL